MQYLNNIVEQDRRATKHIARPMLGFKSMHGGRVFLASIETMHMIRKRQLDGTNGHATSTAKKFYSSTY